MPAPGWRSSRQDHAARARAAGDLAQYALGVRVAGVYWSFAGEPERALEYTTEELALARRRSNVQDLAMALLDHASALIALERLDEAEDFLHELVPLLPQLGSSDLDADGVFDEFAAARGDWVRAARALLANLRRAKRNMGLKAISLRWIAIALARLGADEDALELATVANAICVSIGEASSDPFTERYGSALDEAHKRLGPDSAARATRRGAALPEADSVTRAAEMVQAACVTRAT
jgi:tetratricopeptide (TPR) repeat protein